MRHHRTVVTRGVFGSVPRLFGVQRVTRPKARVRIMRTLSTVIRLP